MANLITVAGANRVLTMDLHADQIQGFFDIPLDNLYASPVLTGDIRSTFEDKRVVVVSPDVGGVARARGIAKRLEADLAIIDKRRPKAGVSEVMNVIGEVEGAHCVLVDDIVDSAGTLCNAAAALMERGAAGVAAYVSHGVLSGPAVERITKSVMTEVVTTNSIKASPAVRECPKIRQLSIAPLMAEAIRRISEEKSVSVLFD